MAGSFDSLVVPNSAASSRGTGALFARVSRNAQRVLVPINDSALEKKSTLPAFYCAHDITGAAASDYVDLARRLNLTVRFFGLQAPERKMEDRAFGSSVESLASYYLDALNAFQPEGPILLGGFCAGGLIALEIAHRMRAAGREVSLLVAIDTILENTPGEFAPWHPYYIMKLVSNVPAWIRHGGLKRQRDSHSLLRRFCHNALLLARLASGRKESDAHGEVHAIDGLMDLSRFPLNQKLFINRFYAACFEYFPETYPGDVVVYEPTVMPIFHLPQLGSRWRAVAPRTEVVAINGTHLSMMQEPHVERLARDMATRIGRAATPVSKRQES